MAAIVSCVGILIRTWGSGGLPVRAIHRRKDAADVWFVANPEPGAGEAWCTFKVTGKQPELWDPVTGAMRDLDRIARGLSLRKVHAGVTYRSGITAQAHDVPDEVLAACRDLGALLGGGIEAGMF